VSLKSRITEDMKTALKAKESERLSAVRLLLAAIKQREVDERIELTDADVVGVVEKLLKQRRDSISQYEAAQRQDLADKEKFEASILQAYMPQPLDEAEIGNLIEETIRAEGASGIKDMGKVMAALKPKVAGRVDMGQVSATIKARLAG
jgi:uncharacterized protein